MANKLISQLIAGGADIQDVDEVEAQINGETQTKKFTGLQMRAVEKSEREAQDDVIEAAAGLNGDGTYPSLTNAWYLRAADFATGITDRGGASGALTENIMNALRILDAKIKENESGSVLISTGINSDTTFNNQIPAGYILEYMIFEETAGNSPTLDLGLTAGNNEVFINQTLEASGLTTVFIGRIFDLSSDTTVYLNDDDAYSDWNSGQVNIYWVLKRIV